MREKETESDRETVRESEINIFHFLRIIFIHAVIFYIYL